jgi:MtN3 and saliva related transmembrane protein
MNWIAILGFVAGAASMVSFLPQVIKSFKTKKTKDLSLGTYVVVCVAAFLWLAYGLLNKDLPIIISNIVALILIFSILSLKLKYG